MWQRAAATVLVIGSLISGVRATDFGQTPAHGATGNFVGPYQRYSLKLRRFRPIPNRVSGVLIKVRINGGRPLQMVLDSGADLIVIGSKAARNAGISNKSASNLVGLGSRPARVGRADKVEVGPVSFQNCRVGVVQGRVVEGADGVVPLNLFSAFRLRLNLHKKTLELLPYPQGQAPATPPAHGAGRHNLLLVEAVLNGEQKGYVVLDTGAFCSGVSRKAARDLSGSPLVTNVPLTTGTGAATGRRVAARVRFAIAKQRFTPREVLAMDLSNVSRHYGVEIIGVLGFPALANHILTIDYRNGWVRIEPPHSRPAPELQESGNSGPFVPIAFH